MSLASTAKTSYADEVVGGGYGKIFEGHTIFLTGGTGCLGGCLLYKLALQLPTRKIFVLVRGDSQRAIGKLRESMPNHVQAILATKKVEFVIGDMKMVNFGIETDVLGQLQDQVTLAIHAAAKIKLEGPIRDALESNCLPALEMARIASEFRRLRLLIQISTSYVNSHLPDGPVLERIYQLGGEEDPEEELASILTLGKSPHVGKFSSTYTQAKHLMERLLLNRFPLLPILLLRPTIFGPAFRHPYPLYGSEDSTPLTKFTRLWFSDRGSTQVWHATEGYQTGTNILDEIPVDLVANSCLLHAAARTTGIVQVGSQLYHPITFDEVFRLGLENATPAAQREFPKIIFTEDRSTPQCFLAELIQVGTRNWLFDCGRSYWLKQVSGPLSMQVCKHEADALNLIRTHDVLGAVKEKARI
ncbi:Male sterility, NAD-binding [Penicillium expansum]|uniref:Fatty acyl-CoA reductase n=1 Tax=Penicillium expansum TaxID=27334 RepID=A0A0A2J079_PENEN|nr:Male sterility, NAD-binding [Penicillium expansum]KAJ5505239.1 Male sterility NAD-binding [Penicillium expansum]KGO48123.1 Male sterility, NAD-binding [Penicillium expansum]KGO59875.1 Male sterility, NAD-binding [Penicillium expansum]KGO69323.1 Male sterility, NAD-binding [Penicillium expansum]